MLLRVAILVLCQCVFGEIAFPDSFPKSGLETRSLQASQPVDSELKSKRTVKTEWIVMPRNVLQAVITATNEALDELEGKELSSWESYRDLCKSIEGKVNASHNGRWICIAGITNEHGAWVHYGADRYVRYTIGKHQFTVFVPSDGCFDPQEDEKAQEIMNLKEQLRLQSRTAALSLRSAQVSGPSELKELLKDKDDLIAQMQLEINRLSVSNRQLARGIKESGDEIQRLKENLKDADIAVGENSSLRRGMAAVRALRERCKEELLSAVQEKEKLQAKCTLSAGAKSEKSEDECTTKLTEVQNQLKRTESSTSRCEASLKAVRNENVKLGLENAQNVEFLDRKNKEILALREETRRCDNLEGQLFNIKSAIRNVANSRTKCESTLNTCEQDKVRCQLGLAGKACDKTLTERLRDAEKELQSCQTQTRSLQTSLDELRKSQASNNEGAECELLRSENLRYQVANAGNAQKLKDQAAEIARLTESQKDCDQTDGENVSLRRVVFQVRKERDVCTENTLKLQEFAIKCNGGPIPVELQYADGAYNLQPEEAEEAEGQPEDAEGQEWKLKSDAP